MKLIERNQLKCFGMPSLVGRRLTVFNVILQIFLEGNLENAKDVLEINNAQIKDALEYCSSLVCKNHDQKRFDFRKPSQN